MLFSSVADFKVTEHILRDPCPNVTPYRSRGRMYG